ncbi:MAG: ester cyclase [Gemmatimonadetes bacterium]|nr:ester cyclase [Gemmatimonadota bacterium]
MTAQSPGTVARIIYNAYATREFEKVTEWIAADAEITNVATGDRFLGPDGFLQHARGWAAAFPDLRVEIQQVGAGEDTAIIEYTFRGTHSGALVSPAGFVPPTWTHVELQLCDSIHLRDGKVVRIASYFDSGTMLRQMGLLSNSPLHATERRAALGLFATEVDNASQQRNKAIVQRFLEEVVNQRNPGAAAATCAAGRTATCASMSASARVTRPPASRTALRTADCSPTEEPSRTDTDDGSTAGAPRSGGGATSRTGASTAAAPPASRRRTGTAVARPMRSSSCGGCTAPTALSAPAGEP